MVAPCLSLLHLLQESWVTPSAAWQSQPLLGIQRSLYSCGHLWFHWACSWGLPGPGNKAQLNQGKDLLCVSICLSRGQGSCHFWAYSGYLFFSTCGTPCLKGPEAALPLHSSAQWEPGAPVWKQEHAGKWILKVQPCSM